MNTKKVMIGIGAALLAAATLIAVGVGSYRAGERRSDTVEIVGESVSDGARTIIVDGDGWNRGPGGFGFLLVPLLIGGVILLFASRRRGWNGLGPHRERELEEWHRRAHADDAGKVGG